MQRRDVQRNLSMQVKMYVHVACIVSRVGWTILPIFAGSQEPFKPQSAISVWRRPY